MTQATSKALLEKHRLDNGGFLRSTSGLQYADNAVDDAFSTIVQWLFHRIPHIHGDGARLPEMLPDGAPSGAAPAVVGAGTVVA